MKLLEKIIRHIRGTQSKEEIFKVFRERGLIIDDTSIWRIQDPNGIDGMFPHLIEIGKNCIFSTNVRILSHDVSTKFLIGYTKIGHVIIGDNVFLGHGVTVLCNVRIGDNVIVGANSLVDRDLEANSVYAGVPAKYICSYEEYMNKHLSKLETSPKFEKGWDYWSVDASMEERKQMKNLLENSNGYVR